MDASLDRIAIPAGSMLFAEHDVGSCAYLIMSGRIEIFLVREGLEVVLATRGPGEIVGEMAIIDSHPRSASARIVADCELVLITADQIGHRLAETDPILRMCLGVVINSDDLERVWLEFGVCDNDELSHDGGNGDEGLFACQDEALVEGL